MSGIFITRRITKLQERGIECDVYSFFIKDCWILELIKKLYRTAFKIPQQKFTPFFHIDDIEYKFIPLKLSIFDRLFYHQRIGEKMAHCIINSIDIKEYNVVHGHWIYPHGYAASLIKKQTGIPCIISAHGSDIHTAPRKDEIVKRKTLYTLENADKIMFVSKALLETAMNIGYNGKNAIVIPNGVDIASFTIKEKHSTRKQLGIFEDNTFYIGYIGNLVEVKRADKLPEIFDYVRSELSNIKFIIIGDGHLQKNIKEECSVKKLDVLFTGIISPDQIPTWMNCLDILVLPSRDEGFGSVIIEAHACGIPVVASDVGGIPEAMGDFKFIVPDGNNFEKRFAEQIISVLVTQTINREKIRFSTLKYSWENTINEEINIYKEVIGDMK